MNRLLDLEKELARFAGRGMKPNTQAPGNPNSVSQSLGYYGYSRQYSDSPEEIRILSIDGGGIRGLIPALILNHIEERIWKRTQEQIKRTSNKFGEDNHPEGGPPIQKYFDVLAGTSTGGIIAAGLACPDLRANGSNKNFHYRASDFVQIYKGEDGRRIFPLVAFKMRKPFNSVSTTYGAAFAARYDRSGLDAVLDKRLGAFANKRRIFFHDLLKPVIIISANFKTGDPVIFKNWESTNYLAADVLRATSAAPTYFDPIGFNQVDPNALPEDSPIINRLDHKAQLQYLTGTGKFETPYYIDGGIWQNNPAAIALSEVRDRQSIFSKSPGRPRIEKTPYRLSNKEVDRTHVVMLSIGTGIAETKFENRDEVAVKAAITAFQQSMIATSRHAEIALRGIISPENYFRFNPPITQAAAENMDDASPENLKELEDLTFKYLAQPDVHLKIEALVTKLVGA